MLRVAGPEHVLEIGRVIDAAYQHYIAILGRKPRPMLDDHTGRVAAAETVVALEQDRIVGVITRHDSDEPDALHIFSIAIDPAAQGSGLLRRLLADAEAEARRRGRSRLTLFTNVAMTRNRAIYAHLGFRERYETEASGYRIVFMDRPVPKD